MRDFFLAPTQLKFCSKQIVMDPKFRRFIIWLDIAFLSIIFFASGMAKMVGAPWDIEDFESLNASFQLMYVVGAVEVLTSIGLFVDRYRLWSATIQAILMTGAIGMHMINGDLHIVGLPLFLGAGAALLVYLLSTTDITAKPKEVEDED